MIFLCSSQPSLSSDLKTGTKFAAFHAFGKQPLSSCLLNRVQGGMDKDFEHFFNRRDISSGPQDLAVFS